MSNQPPSPWQHGEGKKKRIMEKIYKGEIQRLFPIFEAIKEGKTIQWLDMGLWRDIDGNDEGFFLDTLVGETDGYRIKPEPKYRPFANAEECWTEMEKHQPFGWIKSADCCYNIVSVSNIDVSMANVSGDIVTLRFCEVMESDTFADGLPFGVKEEE